MNKLEKIAVASVAVACVCVIIFWISGFNGNIKLTEYSLATGGVFASVAIISGGLNAIKKQQLGY